MCQGSVFSTTWHLRVCEVLRWLSRLYYVSLRSKRGFLTCHLNEKLIRDRLKPGFMISLVLVRDKTLRNL